MTIIRLFNKVTNNCVIKSASGLIMNDKINNCNNKAVMKSTTESIMVQNKELNKNGAVKSTKELIYSASVTELIMDINKWNIMVHQWLNCNGASATELIIVQQ